LKVITGYYFACSRELREITFEANSALEWNWRDGKVEGEREEKQSRLEMDIWVCV
jgi:hypothetical protein